MIEDSVMDLRQYLDGKGEKHVEFAGKVGISASLLSLILAKKRRPSPEVALAIEKATGRKVKRMELLYP